MPDDWEVLELPGFRAARGKLERLQASVAAALALREAPVALAGHSLGAALAVLAALEMPAGVEQLILVSPAGLPLQKSLRASALTFVQQVISGCYPAAALREIVRDALAAPRAALSLAREAHAIDLSPELERLRAQGVRCTVISTMTDRLTTCAHCRELARRAGADYRELSAADGHIWMITQPGLLRDELRRVQPVSDKRPQLP
jgi:pimeloyl-ACP methyl ester carboxylesterase